MIRGEERRTKNTAGATGLPLVALATASATTRREIGASPAGHAWCFDTVHSSIRFSVRRMLLGHVSGQFTKWRGTMAFDPAHPEASDLSVRIDAHSIDTGDSARDAHLRSPDFLHADRHPVLTFQSLGIALVSDVSDVSDVRNGRFAVTGALQIRGVAQEVVLDATYRGSVRDPWGNEHLSFDAKARIDRGAFGLKWNQVMPTGELFVGESVEIAMAIEATRLPGNAS